MWNNPLNPSSKFLNLKSPYFKIIFSLLLFLFPWKQTTLLLILLSSTNFPLCYEISLCKLIPSGRFSLFTQISLWLVLLLTWTFGPHPSSWELDLLLVTRLSFSLRDTVGFLVQLTTGNTQLFPASQGFQHAHSCVCEGEKERQREEGLILPTSFTHTGSI